MSAPANPIVMPATTTIPTASKQTLRYEQDIETDLLDKNLSFVDDANKGHRVTLDVPLNLMQDLIAVTRAAGAYVPTGSIKLVGAANALVTAVSTSLNTGHQWTDLDAGNLSFTNGGATAATHGWDETGTIPEWVFKYILYKVYGRSDYDVSDVTFTTEATSMVTAAQVVIAFSNELLGQTSDKSGNKLDKILQNLIAADPYHFYSAGKPRAVFLDNTNTLPAAAAGLFVPFILGDQIEITFKFTFKGRVTHDDVMYGTTNNSNDGPRLDAIVADESFKVRVLLKATEGTSTGTDGGLDALASDFAA